MTTPLINDVPHILNLGHTKKCIYPDWHTICVIAGFGGPINMVEVFFPTLFEDQYVVEIYYHE